MAFGSVESLLRAAETLPESLPVSFCQNGNLVTAFAVYEK